MANADFKEDDVEEGSKFGCDRNIRRYSMVKRRKSWESRGERGRMVEGVGEEGVIIMASLTRTEVPMAVNLRDDFGKREL